MERPPKEEVAGNDLHIMRTPRRIRAFINGNTLSPVTHADVVRDARILPYVRPYVTLPDLFGDKYTNIYWW